MECADPCANNASGSGVGGENGNGYRVLVLDLMGEMGLFGLQVEEVRNERLL